MPFTGKATYDAGDTLPEIVEDVSDIIGIVSPFETPLLDWLGDPKRPAMSTVHEWLEDSLLPNADQINQTTFTPNPLDATAITVDNGSRFQVGDQVRPAESREVMFVTAVNVNTLTVVRGYGGTTKHSLADNMKLTILGNAALEGADAPAARATNRVRKVNYAQIFSAAVSVSGSNQSARHHGIQDEVDYQKQERMRELLRDLENCVINGTAPATGQVGSASVRRTMNGIIKQVSTNQFVPGQNGFPAGGGTGTDFNELLLNSALRLIWEQSSGPVDTIVCGGFQKRRINTFATAQRAYAPEDTKFRDMVSVYESDFGVCRIIASRWVPADTVLFLDSSRIDVMPLKSRHFHFKPLASTGDSTSGLVVGEYTMEFRNESAHGLVRGLSVT
jgi:Family of unknown function (DUF5309)